MNTIRTNIISICVLVSVSVFAQSQFRAMDQNIGLEFSGSYQYWKAKDDNINQFSFPVAFILPLGDQLLIDFVTTPTTSTAITVQENSLSGLSDTRMRGSFLFDNQRLLFTFGLNLPSGKNRLTTDELSVANILSLHALNFYVPILGQGLDASVGLIMAQPLGPFVLGFGGGYLYRGRYDPYKNIDLSYDPGDEFSLSAGLDIPMTRKDKIYLDFSYTFYTDDRSRDVSVFQAGNRFSFSGMYYLPREIWSYLFTIKSRIQSKNKIGSGDLVPERLNYNNSENELSFTTFLNWDRKTIYHAMLQGKFFANNATGVGADSLGGFGMGFERQLSKKFRFLSSTRFYFGNYDVGPSFVNLFGFEIFGGLKILL